MINRDNELFNNFLELEECPGYGISPLGQVKNLKTGRILKPERIRGQYERVTIGNRKYMVHLLVAKYFVPNDQNGNFVKHINGDNSDNFFDNLVWVAGDYHRGGYYGK
jgi:hypothetical protein